MLKPFKNVNIFSKVNDTFDALCSCVSSSGYQGLVCDP